MITGFFPFFALPGATSSSVKETKMTHSVGPLKKNTVKVIFVYDCNC